LGFFSNFLGRTPGHGTGGPGCTSATGCCLVDREPAGEAGQRNAGSDFILFLFYFIFILLRFAHCIIVVSDGQFVVDYETKIQIYYACTQ
jgi:hypothetical protein